MTILFAMCYYLTERLCRPVKEEPVYDTLIIKRDSLKSVLIKIEKEENEEVNNIRVISNDSVYNLFKELVSK